MAESVKLAGTWVCSNVHCGKRFSEKPGAYCPECAKAQAGIFPVRLESLEAVREPVKPRGGSALLDKKPFKFFPTRRDKLAEAFAVARMARGPIAPERAADLARDAYIMADAMIAEGNKNADPLATPFVYDDVYYTPW